MTSRPIASQAEVLDAITFDALVAEQLWFDQERPAIDLTNVTFISSAALAQIAAICHGLDADGKRAVLVVPEPAVRTYLVRSGFVAAVEAVADLDPPLRPMDRAFQAQRGSSPLLIEVTRLEYDALPDLLGRIALVLRDWLGYTQRDADSAAIAISEVSQNGLDHGKGAPCFLAMQVYGAGTGQFLNVGVADCGVGLRRSLERNPANSYNSDDEAIRDAMDLGTSGYEDPTRGTGLWHLLQITHEYQGSVQIRSGTVKARYRADKEQGWIFSVVPVPGVHVELKLGRRSAA